MIVGVASEEQVNALVAWIRAAGRFGTTEVVDAQASTDEDASGVRAYFIDVTLADPPKDDDSWPLEDVLELHRRVNDKAAELLDGERWHVRLRPVTDDVADDDLAEDED